MSRVSTKKVSKKLPNGNSDLLNVPDLSFCGVIYFEISNSLASSHFVVFVGNYMIIIPVLGEAMRCSNHHSLRNDGSTTNLLIILVNAYMPWYLSHARVVAWIFEKN